MRRGVADMYRRAEVSQAANDRYAEALASLDKRWPFWRMKTPWQHGQNWPNSFPTI